MFLSVLLKKLSEIEEPEKRIVNIEVGYFGGAYGGHNCYSESAIEDIEVKKNGKIVLSGWSA